MKIQRTELYRELPLTAPFSLHIYPSFYCNFRCCYCLHSLSEEQLREKGFQRQYMDFDLYRKAIDNAASVNWRMKAMIFAGHGEPLLHPRIADMVAYAKEKGVTDRAEIVTNGSLLTAELSDALIGAGLDRLRVSLQGTSAETYREMCGAKLDFERYIEQLRYFYSHKTSTDVYIKIIDVALKGEEDKERFEKLFGDVADTVAVEHAIPFVPEIDLGKLSGESKQGGNVRSKLCSMPFYMLVLYPNGDVLPCCSTEVPTVFGNITRQSLQEIWNSEVRNRFLLRQLDGADGIPVCRECSVPAFGLQEGDRLDGHEDELRRKYKT